MLGTYYYHEILRKTIIGFGTLFNNIEIQHKDDNNGVVSTLKVPLNYGPAQKFLARITQQKDLNRPYAITLPRMSFEHNSIQYDPTRKSSITQTFRAADSGGNVKKVFMPVPYNIGFELNILSKLNDDALQIVEQILPYFQPSFNITVDLIDSIGEKRDIPIILESITQTDEYEGDFQTRQVLRYDLEFVMKNYLYGPVIDSKIIKEANVRTYMESGTGKISNTDTAGKVVDQSVTTNPPDADSDDTFTYNETTEFFEQPSITYSDDKSSDPK